MGKLELMPTYDVIKRTLLDDVLKRNEALFRFVNLLDSISDSCVIALDGQWGSGKTFFVKQTQMILDSLNTLTDEKNEEIKLFWQQKNKRNTLDNEFVTIYFDAWENDDDDALLSLIYGILVGAKEHYEYANGSDISNTLKTIVELNPMNKLSIVKSITEAIKNNFKDDFQTTKNSRELRKTINEFIRSLIAERGDKLVIIIDELDRCNPIFAVKLLERVKHYFDNDQVIFVFATNLSELQNTIKQYYGHDFNAFQYLDRFFDLRVELPKANLDSFYKMLSFNSIRYSYDITMDYFINKYNLELRQITKYIRLCRMAAYEVTHTNIDFRSDFSDQKTLEFCFCYIVPILIGLKLYDIEEYNQFISGKSNAALFKIFATNLDKDVFFRDLLNNETYDRRNNIGNKKIVTVNDKLNSVYVAIFGNASGFIEQETTVGIYTFNNKHKDFMTKVIGLLSEYATLR